MHRDELPLSFSCEKRWDDMEGSGCARWCGACEHTVVDLSAHTALGARLRLATHLGPEAPCVTYVTDASGAVRHRPSWLARLAAALLTALPLSAAAEAPDDAEPQPGQVHLCSQDTGVERLIGKVSYRRFLRLRRMPRGRAVAHVAADPERFRAVAVRCEGSPLPKRTRLHDGEALVESLPEDTACTARFRGRGRPLRVDFVAGDAHTEVEVTPRTR